MKRCDISRRDFLGKATITGAVGVAAPAILVQPLSGDDRDQTDKQLSTEVQMQLMRPGQLEKAMRAFPVVYVPFGLIEWHGRHLPLGCDALKAHGILVKCAEQYGGVVYPPIYFPSAQFIKDSNELKQEDEWKVNMLTGLFNNLKFMGTRVIIGVSGHNIIQQILMINRALEPVVSDGNIKGIGLWEMTLSKGPESDSDHAAKWETSDMMYLYPETVDLSALGKGPLAPDMKPPDGIGGLDPRVNASSEVGRRNVELAAAAIGKKAKELLESLPEDKRGFNKPCICPESWWQI